MCKSLNTVFHPISIEIHVKYKEIKPHGFFRVGEKNNTKIHSHHNIAC